MRDVLFVGLIIAFFVLCVAYISACVRIVGRETVIEAAEPDDVEAEAA
jgi:hypothetical protein